MTCADILALSSTNAREWARAATDRDLLVEVRDAANADTDRPRRSLLAAIEFRLAALDAIQSEDDEVARDDSPPPAEEAPVVHDARVVATEPDVDLTTCARAFVAALASGDVALVASMIDDVRRNAHDRMALAEALVSVRQDVAVVAPVAKPARVRTVPTAGANTPIAERFAQAASLGTTSDDGAIILDREAMTRAGFPASWHTASLWHVTYGSARQAARRHGFEGELRSGVLTLRPHVG